MKIFRSLDAAGFVVDGLDVEGVTIIAPQPLAVKGLCRYFWIDDADVALQDYLQAAK